ncbi:MAG: ABC transporter substrate-binding protein, partial [Chloroflexota bacterium]
MQADPFVSSGPYRLRFRRVRDRVRVERNPHYWDAARPSFAVLDFLAVESSFTALNLFLAGEADYAPSVPPLAVPRLLTEHGDAFRPSPQFASLFLRLNLRNALLADRDLRLSLARSVDREALAAAAQAVEAHIAAEWGRGADVQEAQRTVVLERERDRAATDLLRAALADG